MNASSPAPDSAPDPERDARSNPGADVVIHSEADAAPVARHRLPVLIVLASGRGERFRASGGTVHKLRAPLAGRTVIEHTLAAARESGLPWHLEDAGHAGMGDSIAAAVRATRGAAGWLILPADLPLVQPASIRAVAAALGASAEGAGRGARTIEGMGAKIGSEIGEAVDTEAGAEIGERFAVTPWHGESRGHPVAFSAACGPDLQALSGDRGAAPVLQALQAEGRVRRLALDDAGIVTDIDTLDDLARAEALLGARSAGPLC